MIKREGRASLFKNDKKDGPQKPDYTGSMLLGGVQYVLAGWINTGKSKWISISVQKAVNQPRDDEELF